MKVQLGPYQAVRELPAGPLGPSYLCQAQDKHVVVQVLSPELVADPQVRAQRCG